MAGDCYSEWAWAAVSHALLSFSVMEESLIGPTCSLNTMEYNDCRDYMSLQRDDTLGQVEELDNGVHYMTL